MSELTRTIVRRLRELLSNRRRAKRSKVRLPFSVSLVEQQRSSKGARRGQSIDGHTLDISTSGLGLVVSAIRFGEHYLVGENRRLQIKLELPGGAVEMQVNPARYESFDEHETETGYLIGVRIVQMSEQHRAHYNEYIARLQTTPR